MIRLYGIPNCDTIKKARRWLTENGVAHEFVDYQKSGVDETRLRLWVKQVGWEQLLNRRGTTWRRLDETLRTRIDEPKAIALMLEQPSIIKRPVLEAGRRLLVGFDPEAYRNLLVLTRIR